jgi:hypothetical protein
MAGGTLTRTYDFERQTKRFARYRARPRNGADEADVGVLYVLLESLGETPMQSSFEMTLTPTDYEPEPQPVAAKSGKVAA